MRGKGGNEKEDEKRRKSRRIGGGKRTFSDFSKRFDRGNGTKKVLSSRNRRNKEYRIGESQPFWEPKFYYLFSKRSSSGGIEPAT
jgi:hypothetical protein